jgi:cell division septation protein DedD
MKIFTEISNVTRPNDPFGPTTNHRQIQNTVYVRDGESVLIGGIIQDQLDTEANRVPLLSRLPLLGVLFRAEAKDAVKTNLLLLLTPHIVRDPADLEQLTLEGRERFRSSSGDPQVDEARRKAREAGLDLPVDPNPVRRELETLTDRYPTQKLPSLREPSGTRAEQPQPRADPAAAPPGRYLLQLQPLDDAAKALALLGVLQASGYNGALVLEPKGGRMQHSIRLGPYPSEAEARRIGLVVKAQTELDTFVILGP